MSLQHPVPTRTAHQVSTPYSFTALAPSSFPSHPDTSICPLCKQVSNRRRREPIAFNVLPDDVLLEIFDIYVIQETSRTSEDIKREWYQWITLVHVCQRWRTVVFQSPHRLNLRLVCTRRTPARDIRDLWPPLPLIIFDHGWLNLPRPKNIIAALEHNDRVCEIELINQNWPRLDNITSSAAILKPFPELTRLYVHKWEESEEPEPILPDSLLAGTAPRLQVLKLCHIPFPGLPKLLLSATHLVHLDLSNISRSGYFRPELMATSLSALTNLEFLRLEFIYPRPRPALDSRRPPPPPLTRSILPNLTKIEFDGASEYLEEILTRIDAPRLNELHIAFFNQLIFDTPQLFQFISRSPTLRAPEKGHIAFSYNSIIIKFTFQASDCQVLKVKIRSKASEWQLSSLEQVFTSCLPPLSTVEDLYIVEGPNGRPVWQDDVENTLWLDLLRSFAAVKNLYLSEEFVPRITPALQELVGGRMTEVLPTLKNIFFEEFQQWGLPHEGIEKFVAARQLTSHAIADHYWDRDRENETEILDDWYL